MCSQYFTFICLDLLILHIVLHIEVFTYAQLCVFQTMSSKCVFFIWGYPCFVIVRLVLLPVLLVYNFLWAALQSPRRLVLVVPWHSKVFGIDAQICVKQQDV